MEATLFFWNLAAVWAMMTAGWVLSLIWRNVTVVDSLWGLGFVLMAWLSVGFGNGYSGRGLLLAGLVTIWGLRLSAYLTSRNWGKGEDSRYGKWRQAAGNRFWITSLFKVFWLQALFLWLIGLSLQFGILRSQPSHLTWLDGIGTLVWGIGMGFEAISDAQLARFKKDPSNRGKVMDKGLWGWSRHPNYFGEALLWWGIYLVTLSTPGSFWTGISPILITLVLTRMTGVPLTEKTILEKRPGYRKYVETVPAFFPKMPRRKAKP